MRGRGHHRAYAGAPQGREGEAVVVEGQGDRAQTGRREQRGVLRAARILHSDRGHALVPEYEAEEGGRLGHPRADHEPLRIGHHAPAPGEQSGQGLTEFRQPARIGVAERAVRQPAEHRPLGGTPRAAREEGQVGGAGPEVHQCARRARRAVVYRALRRAYTLVHPGTRALPAAQIALRGELLVRLGDQSARHAQISRELTARRQPRAGREATGADRFPQCGPECAPPTARRCGSGGQQQLPGRREGFRRRTM
ncbi:hypothetical protein QF048_006492 [Streptomyces sp. W4I9-2]|nr:hypothetical protein [Streptomyces sp. W4I9-2]